MQIEAAGPAVLAGGGRDAGAGLGIRSEVRKRVQGWRVEQGPESGSPPWGEGVLDALLSISPDSLHFQIIL